MNHQQLMAAVKERDNYRCVLCGGMGTQAHHVVSRGRAKAYPEVWSLQNMVTVCAGCHIDAPGGKGAHNQKARYKCVLYLVLLYGREWYERRSPWAEILRRCNE